MVYKMNDKNEIYEKYKRTIKPAITKAVEMTRNQDLDFHVEIYLNDSGVVCVSKLLSSISSVNSNKITTICDVDAWVANIFHYEDENYENTKIDEQIMQRLIKDKVEFNEVVKDCLYPYPQKN